MPNFRLIYLTHLLTSRTKKLGSSFEKIQQLKDEVQVRDSREGNRLLQPQENTRARRKWHRFLRNPSKWQERGREEISVQHKRMGRRILQRSESN